MFRDNFRDGTGTKPCNVLRILECVLCSICLSLAIYILIHIRPFHVVLKSVFLLTSAAYFFITLTDIIVTSLLKPLLWTSWILFALMGVLAFFLCSGFLIMQIYPFDIFLYSATLIANTLTAAVFLFDLLDIISWLVNKEATVIYIKEAPVSGCSRSTGETSTPSYKSPKQADKANQFSGNPLQITEYSKTVQCPSDSILRRQTITCIKGTCPKKCFSPPEVPSHGGTFHVSKDVAPILSPTPLRKINLSSGNTPANSPRNVCRHDSMSIEKNVVESTTIRNRTVSTSTRMVPKQNEATICNVAANYEAPLSADGFAYEKSDDRRKQGIYQPASELCRPYSSQINKEVWATPSSSLKYYTCAYCGRIHHYATTDAFAPCGDSNNPYKFQRLPTLHESVDEPTKDWTCPYPSPTSSNSSKVSTCSGVSANACSSGSKTNQPSPKFNPSLINTSTLEKTEFLVNELYRTGKAESQQPCLYNTHVTSTSKRKDLNAKKPRNTGQWANAIFSFESQCKNKEIQTEPYETEIKNDFTCTCNDFIDPTTYPQDCCQSNIFSQEDNYDVANEEIDSCGCQEEGMDLRLRDRNSSNMDEETVLPGAADRSPKSNENADKCILQRPQQQQHAVIHISEEKSNLSILDLMPTRRQENSQPGVRQRRRKSQDICTMM